MSSSSKEKVAMFCQVNIEHVNIFVIFIRV